MDAKSSYKNQHSNGQVTHRQHLQEVCFAREKDSCLQKIGWGCCSREENQVGEVHRELSLMPRPYMQQKKDPFSLNQQKKIRSDELTKNPLFYLPALSVGKREGLGRKSVLKVYFTSHYPLLNLLIMNFPLHLLDMSLFCS